MFVLAFASVAPYTCFVFSLDSGHFTTIVSAKAIVFAKDLVPGTRIGSPIACDGRSSIEGS